MLDADIDNQIVPFKGEYFRLPAKYNDLVKHLIKQHIGNALSPAGTSALPIANSIVHKLANKLES
jgi:hypothetical protein